MDNVIDLVNNFKVNKGDIDYLRKEYQTYDEEYFKELELLNINSDLINTLKINLINSKFINICNNKSPNSLKEFLVMSGPIYILKLLIWQLENIISFSSLVATNSLRMKLVASNNKKLLEFGLRRAQGPMAGELASKYSYYSSFDLVSNVYAGYLHNMPITGTCAHSFIMSYQGQSNISQTNKSEISLFNKKLFDKCLLIRDKYFNEYYTNISELLAFCSYVSIYKNKSILLCDTYDFYKSGLINTIIVAIALSYIDKSITIFGIRLDSGDMAEQSKIAKKRFFEESQKHSIKWIKDILVSASNDINEDTLNMFNKSKHEIDAFGIGTNLVTCQKQPYIETTCRLRKYDNTINDKQNLNILKLDKNVFNLKNNDLFKNELKESIEFLN